MFWGSWKYQSTSQIRLIKLRYSAQNFTFSQSADVQRGMSRQGKQGHRSTTTTTTTTPSPLPPLPPCLPLASLGSITHTSHVAGREWRNTKNLHLLLSVNHEGFGWGRDRCVSSQMIFNWIQKRSASKMSYIILMIYNNSLAAAASIFQPQTSELYNITQEFSPSNCFSISFYLNYGPHLEARSSVSLNWRGAQVDIQTPTQLVPSELCQFAI